MRYDFTDVADIDLFNSIPEGQYLCRVVEVRDRRARDGSPRWTMRLEVVDGEYAGRTAGWDALTWSDRGVHRVQQVLCALGVDARGEVNLEPNELLGRTARVTFELEEREDPTNGKRSVRLRVPYAGFEPAGIDAEGGGEESSGDGSANESAAAAF